jgi:hypothetical protein
MKNAFITIALLVGCCTTISAQATEYIYRELMANTLPSAQCETEDKAMETAQKNYTLDRHLKKFCQTQGYGWHVNTLKDSGKVICSECTDKKGLQKCHLEDVIVSCQRIKPGTVGMLPGKG